MEETKGMQLLFDEAIQVKEQRGQQYGNNEDSAYMQAIKLMGNSAAVWPIVQKTMRLVQITQDPNFRLKDASAAHDTVIDLICYAAMFYADVVEPQPIKKEEDNGKQQLI